MNSKTRIALIVLGTIALFGYFAFATFLFNPLESDFEADVAALVPRDVDFFVAKSDVDELFDPFPRLAAMDEIEKSPAWNTWIASPEYAALAEQLQLDKTIAEIQQSLQSIPLGMQPLEIFGGSDLAIAGYFNGRELAQADWAAYGHVNWAGKLAASALTHPKLFRLEKQGLNVTEEQGYVRVQGATLPRELYVTRMKDVVVIATKKELVTAAHELVAKRYADSLHQSANYFDHVTNANRSPEKDEFEVYVNARKLVESLALPTPWPDTRSQEFTPALLGRLFQLASLKDAVGVIGIDHGLAIDLHGDFSSELITPEQAKFYRTRSFDERMLLDEAARLAPRDTALFAYVHGRIGDLLRQMLASAEPALRQNLETAFRNTGKYQNLEQLVKELDAALKDRMVVVVRPNDYPPDPDGPPHNDDPVPAAAIVLWTQDVEAIKALRELIGGQGSKFGLQGRKPNEPGYFKNTEAGFETREFWSQFVPGTGIIATGNAGELTIITNSLGMLGHIIKTYTQGGTKYPRLSEEPRFETLVRSSLPRGNVFLWANPETAAPILKQSARRWAEDSIRIDWKLERARVEDQVLREQFPGKRRGALSAEEQAQLDEIVEPKLKSLEARVKAEQVPAMMAKQERWITYMEQATSALVMLALDPKSFDLSVRVTVPMTAAQATP